MSGTEENVDYLTKRPRTPNTRYTELTDEQLRNIKSNTHPFFHSSKPDGPTGLNGAPREGGRFYKDRYGNGIASEHNIRGPSLSQPFMYITEKYERDAPVAFNSHRLGAASTWGPITAGERSMRHFTAEDKNDYGMIDCLRRHPTNQPGQIIFKYGRPHHGYYVQKNPSVTTWFGASCPLNRASDMEVLQPRTMSEYAELSDMERTYHKESVGAEWPGFTEYTDKYLLCSSSTFSGSENKTTNVDSTLNQEVVKSGTLRVPVCN